LRPGHLLLCYDISNPRRLARVHRRVRRAGLSLQYSLFYLEMGAPQVDELLRDLAALIHEDEDDLRLYAVGAAAGIEQFGQAFMPQGISLMGAGTLL
jgi:CRISPR-associated protein Cas2